MIRKSKTLLIALLVGVMAAGSALAKEVVFADWSWDSALVHNRIAGFVAEHGFGYDVDYIFADTQPGFLGMRRGDIDVSMETWVDNIQDVWNEAIEEGTVVDLGPNFPNAPQGWYVPTYMIEGDAERGIEPRPRHSSRLPTITHNGNFFTSPGAPRKADSSTA